MDWSVAQLDFLFIQHISMQILFTFTLKENLYFEQKNQATFQEEKFFLSRNICNMYVER